MKAYLINGGNKLRGTLRIHGAKNAILPILAACVMSSEQIILHDCPALTDVENMMDILRHLGCNVERQGSDDIVIDPGNADRYDMPDDIAKAIRSSIFMLGSILGRFKKARLSYPGGCDIGLRPIDLHLNGLKQLGATIYEQYGYIYCTCEKLVGTDVFLDYPSVGATENIMMAAVLASGTTVIRNAAREPEIVDLQDFINMMGGKISGAGSSTITIHGVEKLTGAEYTVIPDRIVTGTMMVATAIAGGEVLLENVIPEHVQLVCSKLKDAGCVISCFSDKISISMNQRPISVHTVETLPYPGFPTDMQAQFMALQCISAGTCVVVENLFENRFKHAAELKKMGANITIKDRTAIIRGVDQFFGADVNAHDLRGGAGLVLAGIKAYGNTRIMNVNLIDRGYFKLNEQLSELGANISLIEE